MLRKHLEENQKLFEISYDFTASQQETEELRAALKQISQGFASSLLKIKFVHPSAFCPGEIQAFKDTRAAAIEWLREGELLSGGQLNAAIGLEFWQKTVTQLSVEYRRYLTGEEGQVLTGEEFNTLISAFSVTLKRLVVRNCYFLDEVYALNSLPGTEKLRELEELELCRAFLEGVFEHANCWKSLKRLAC
ncbi:hypothetical protein [Pajaroellobacter abortibovis]|uniref:Uncharacterized protein n=1 Tax=Pajaroellobacter abortibovis TaxID=1882918 RepID=A0A1L6MVL9_9BACT|nr:hypothetical protein [Pajaroellobacter abortibovis]APR99551.1 hypothetical protein BCY86_01790 [Pajaroellobacter abortibovis]